MSVDASYKRLQTDELPRCLHSKVQSGPETTVPVLQRLNHRLCRTSEYQGIKSIGKHSLLLLKYNG